MNRRAWWATVWGVPNSQIQLSTHAPSSHFTEPQAVPTGHPLSLGGPCLLSPEILWPVKPNAPLILGPQAST